MPGTRYSNRGAAGAALVAAALTVLAPQPGTAAPRTFKVRVWASSDYRSEVRDWQTKFQRVVQRVNQLIELPLEARLEVVEARAWERPTHDADMAALVDELEKKDPGEDVDWVIGLITAMPTTTGSFHLLGEARSLSRHFILRNLAEAHAVSRSEALAQAYWGVDAKDRNTEENAGARRQHRELVLFLHEWGHTLGALHHLADNAIMNPTYGETRDTFDRANQAIVRIGLRHRATPGRAGGDSPEQREELLAFLSRGADPQWDRADLDELKAMLAPSPRSTVAAAPQSDNERLQRAAWASQHADYRSAWELASEVASHRRDDAAVQRLACEAGCRAHADAGAITRACDAALALRPDDAMPLLLLGTALLDEKQLPEGRAVAMRLAAPGSGACRLAPAFVDDLLHRALLPIESEEVARACRSRNGPPQWAARLRARYALSPRVESLGLAHGAEEADYLDAQVAIDELLGAGKLDEAEARITPLGARFPRLPAGAQWRCGLLLLRRQAGAARAACEAALAVEEELPLAQRYLGLAAALGGDVQHAILALERARALDPDDAEAWQALARLYRSARQPARVVRLRNDYRARFGRPLPP